jgi:hypothetical protein
MWASENANRPNIAKRLPTVRKVLHVIFFDNTGPVMRILVPKGKTVTGYLSKNYVIEKLKKYYESRRTTMYLYTKRVFGGEKGYCPSTLPQI